MGLSSIFARHPTPGLDGTDDGLPPFVNVDVFDRHSLLALPAVTVESLKQRGVSAREFVRLAQVLLATFERLLPEHCPPIALHRGVVGRDHLSRKHAFKLILRLDAHESG